MDYKELIKSLKEEACHQRVVFGSHGVSCQLEGAAAAIETLLAERDAAVKELRGCCGQCKDFHTEINAFPCVDCCFGDGKNDHWQWCGTQKGEPHGE